MKVATSTYSVKPVMRKLNQILEVRRTKAERERDGTTKKTVTVTVKAVDNVAHHDRTGKQLEGISKLHDSDSWLYGR